MLSKAKQALNEQGRIVISLPNVRFFPVLSGLIRDADWQYSESGVLDKTHLRFFTKKSMQDMLTSVGLGVEKIHGINWESTPLYLRALNLVLARRFDDLSYPQFAIVAAPLGNSSSVK